MVAPRTRARIARLHRWLAVALSPVILLIVLSGAVLAFRPILQPNGDAEAAARHVDVARLTALVAREEANRHIGFVGVSEDGRTAILDTPTGPAPFDVATGDPAPMPQDRKPDVFDIAMRVHRDLWFGLGALVSLGSIALIFLVIAGPFLARATSGRGMLGRHIRVGWVLWPLVALLPISLVMTKLRLPYVPSHAAASLTMTQALTQASHTADLSQLGGMQLLPSGQAFFVLVEHGEGERFILADGVARPLDNRVSKLGLALHEGTWAGRWSGMLNVLSAACLLWMLVSGLLSFARRRTMPHTPTERA